MWTQKFPPNRHGWWDIYGSAFRGFYRTSIGKNPPQNLHITNHQAKLFKFFMGESGAWRIHQSAMMMCGLHFFKCFEESMQVGTNPGVSCATRWGWLHSESLTGARSSRLGRLYSCEWVGQMWCHQQYVRRKVIWKFENHFSVSVQRERAKKLGWKHHISCWKSSWNPWLPGFLCLLWGGLGMGGRL